MQKAVVNATAFLCSGSSEYSAFEPFKQIQTGRIAIKVSYPAKRKPPQMISSAAKTIYKKQASRICMRGKAFLGTAAAVTSAARPLVFLLIIHHMQKREKRNLSFRRNIKHSLSARLSSRKCKSSPLFRRYR